jgi:predicted PurR-regulated permease PerM
MEENTNTNNEQKPLASANRHIEFYLKIIAVSCSMIVITILFLLMYNIRQILGVFVLAFLISYIISPAVHLLERRGLNRTLTVGLLYLAFIAVIIVCVLIFLPLIWKEP